MNKGGYLPARPIPPIGGPAQCVCPLGPMSDVLGALQKAEAEKWRPIIKAAGIKAE